ncbi:MAG TPA: hypothetical protein VIJ59_02750 [Caulobacteraceae bacterium]
MDLTKLNRISATAPVIMSLAAVALLLFALVTGWERGLKDEGAVAHIFQLLIALQAPLIVAFLATADWRRLPAIVRVGALQAGALILALAPVALLRL